MTHSVDGHMDAHGDGTATSRPTPFWDTVKISTCCGPTLGMFCETAFVPFTAMTGHH